MASDDPDFETNAADVILPLSPGRVERHGFECRRNGTLSLYAALEVKTGKVPGKIAELHTSAEFVDFLEQVFSADAIIIPVFEPHPKRCCSSPELLF